MCGTPTVLLINPVRRISTGSQRHWIESFGRLSSCLGFIRTPMPPARPRGPYPLRMSMFQPQVSIVLPVYNEGEAVEPVVRALTAGIRTTHELVVVYDFDEDTTVPVVARLAA